MLTDLRSNTSSLTSDKVLGVLTMHLLHSCKQALYIRFSPIPDTPDEEVSVHESPFSGRILIVHRNLDAAEARCSALIAIIHRISPDLDIQAALNGTAGDLEGRSTASLEASHTSDPDVESTALSERFEWRETSLNSPAGPQKAPLDGMASLPTGRTESGYLG